MVTCMDVNNLKLDGMELVAGESGLKRMVSWTYLVQTRPYEEHMNRGNFALIVVDFIRFDFKEVRKTMEELNELGISGLAVSVVDDKENIPKSLIKRANELCLPLFNVRWKGVYLHTVRSNQTTFRHMEGNMLWQSPLYLRV